MDKDKKNFLSNMSVVATAITVKDLPISLSHSLVMHFMIKFIQSVYYQHGLVSEEFYRGLSSKILTIAEKVTKL